MFPYKSYTGKWLHIDLTTGQIEPRELDPALAQNYLGGNGFGARLLWEREPPLVLMDDPLVNFDPQRRQAAVEMIRALADDTQVLLFTCQHWYDDAADRIITL